MKKIVSIIIAALMLASICVPSFAADITTNGGTGDAIVKTKTVDEAGESAEKFIVKIPATTEIPWGKDSQALTYSVESHLGYGKKLTVNVSGHGVMTYTVGADSMTLDYTLGGTTAFTAADPVVYPAADQTINVNVADRAWKSAVVGEYQDTLTFTVAIAEV